MPEWLRPEDLIWLAGVGTVALTTIVQKLSSKFKPWSWLAEQFGNAINKTTLEKLDKLESKVAELEKRDNQQDEEREEERALSARRRILRFADECRRQEKHSEEYFNNILEDISMYKDYCDTHPMFENEKAIIAIQVIDETYKRRLDKNDFL